MIADRTTPKAGDLTTLRAGELAQRITARELSAVEVTEAHIARIEQVDPRLNAVVVRLFDEARRAAQACDAQVRRGEPLGPLHGVPVTIKECFDLTGTPSTLGVRARQGHRAGSDAPLVSLLKQAGAVVLGKTNVSQLLMFVETDNPIHGRTNNPWNVERSAGGSSGGEGAIIAAGGSALGLGTDIGGSVRVPAHFNGISSIKPTPGRLPLAGTPCAEIFPGNEAIPDSAGLLGRSVVDLQTALRVLTGGLVERGQQTVPVPLREPVEELRGLRIGVYEEDGYFPASASVKRAVREAAAALRQLGATVEPFRPPQVEQGLGLFYALLGAGGGHGWKRLLAGGPVDPRVKELLKLTNIPPALRPLITSIYRRRGQRYVAGLMPVAKRYSAAGYQDLIAERDVYRRQFDAALQAGGFDALICPPNCLPAFTHGASKELAFASVCYTALYNLLGWPAGVTPVTRVRLEDEQGLAPSKDLVLETARRVDQGSVGLPLGVQVAARPWREDLVLGVMAALEGALCGRADYPRTPPL